MQGMRLRRFKRELGVVSTTSYQATILEIGVQTSTYRYMGTTKSIERHYKSQEYAKL